LSLHEFETQEWMRRALAEIPGVELVDGEWGTGVVALLRGAEPGPVVAWRTDMDGLPITEATGLGFACARRDTVAGGGEVGVMHACGHDFHMAIAVGMLRVLSGVRERLPGTVLLIAEPAEEIGAGASMLLEAGLFDDGRRPSCVLALHVHPTIASGRVGFCPGPSTANVDTAVLRVRGQGGHGAYPHKAVDPVSLAAEIVLAFESIVAREIDVNHPAVISVGKIEGGTKSNVIPDEVVLEATVRSHDEATRLLLQEKIARTVKGLAAARGAPEPVLDYQLGTPAGYNDPALVEQGRDVFREVVGAGNEIRYDTPMGGEDFAYYGREVPGFQFRLGVGRPDREMALHSGVFDPDEDVLPIGVHLAAALIWDQLHRR
ncbi:MAG: amidohydrolase, partial [Candidatus Eisenbacteria bacterium]|nr:amidohydrolase [Candidatus Eisenbacteria bacterium]